MTLFDPLARRLERFVYGRICALSDFVPPDRGVPTGLDALASPLDGNELRATTR